MDKASAKKLLLKDINSLITHVNDILDSKDVGISSYQADYIIDRADDLKDYITDELALSNADEELNKKSKVIDVDKVLKGDISKEDEEEWAELLKDIRSSRTAKSTFDDSDWGGGYSGSSCGSSGYSSPGGCYHGNSGC